MIVVILKVKAQLVISYIFLCCLGNFVLTSEMDSDEEHGTPVKKGLQTRTKTVEKKQGGLLSDLYSSPIHEPVKKDWLEDDMVDDTLTFIRQTRAQAAADVVRPLTAMSQADYIPDLDEMQDLNDEAVKAPLVEPSALSSYQDLEKDILKTAAFASFDGIDMNPLFSRLMHSRYNIVNEKLSMLKQGNQLNNDDD